MKTLVIENDVFFEDEEIPNNSAKIASRYFNVEQVDHHLKYIGSEWNVPDFWRGSFGLKGRMRASHGIKENDDKFNCLYWLPELKEYAHNSEYKFLDADAIRQLPDEMWPMFVKPVKGTKSFSGNVFSKEKFQEEFNFFTRNLNISPYIICQYSPPKPIEKEYRCIIIDNKIVHSCQYLENAERVDKPDLTWEIWLLAQEIANKDFFLNFPNFVVDVAQNGDIFKLLEVNSIHTSSYYSCDLDLIYSRLAKYYENQSNS